MGTSRRKNSESSTVTPLADSFVDDQSSGYDEQIRLENANVEYILTFEEGSTCKGITDNYVWCV